MAPKLPKALCETIKKLACLDHDGRAEGVEELQQFLSQTPLPSEVTIYKNMMIIWKGLHCAMLRQPEPLKQEELADKLSSLIYCFKKEKHVNLFIKAAMEIFEREWHNVNTFFVDKFMMFFRRVLRQALFRLADQKWRHSDMFMKMMEEVVIRPLDDDHQFKVSVKMHLSSIFMEELAKAHNEHFTHATLMIFLQPYIKVVTLSRDARYVADVHCNIFQHLIRQSDVGVDSRADLQENEILVEKNSGRPVKPSRKRPGQESDEEGEEVMNEGDDEDQEWESMEEDSDEEEGDDQDREFEEVEDEGDDGELEEVEDVSDEDGEDVSDEDGEMDEDEDGEDVSDEDEEMDEDEDGEDDESDLDDDEEYPLDPRAGNVDVVLPQIEVDYEMLSKALIDIMHSEESQIRYKNLRKLRTLVRQLQDVACNVFPLGQHPTVLPLHKLMEDDVADVDLDKATQKRMELYNEEFKADPKLKKKDEMNMEELEQLYAKTKKTKNIIQKERAHKWIALNLKKRQYEKRKEELRFKKYAKRTLKLKSKVDNRRLKAQGLLLTSDDKQKLFQEKSEEKRRALLDVIANATNVGSSARNSSKAPSPKAAQAASSSASPSVATDALDSNRTTSSEKMSKGSTKKPVAVNGLDKLPKVSSMVEPQTVTSKTPTKKSSKVNDLKTSSKEIVTKAKTKSSPKVQPLKKEKCSDEMNVSTKKYGKKFSIKETTTPKVAPIVAKSQEPSSKIAGAKRSRSVDQSPVRAAKKVKTLDAQKKSSSLASPSPSKMLKKKSTTPTSIKISLKHNKQHEYLDYHRSIQASPAIPFQPDRTPASSVLKATNSPILVKKPFSKTLKSIPTNAKFEAASPSLKQTKVDKPKKAKVSPYVLKGLQRKGMSLDDISEKKSPKVEISVKEKSLKSPKVTSAKPVAKKHNLNRPSAADFF